MATRMSVRCAVGSVLTLAGLAACAQAQYLYAGPGTVVQRQVNGPFLYNFYGYPYMVPGSYLSPPVWVPVPRPYLYAPPQMLPPAYGALPNFYRPRPPLPGPSYGGYQPRPNRPGSAGPTTSPGPSAQIAGQNPSAVDQRGPGTALPQKFTPPRGDSLSAPRPPATPPTSGQVRPGLSPDSDPNRPAENLLR